MAAVWTAPSTPRPPPMCCCCTTTPCAAGKAAQLNYSTQAPVGSTSACRVQHHAAGLPWQSAFCKVCTCLLVSPPARDPPQAGVWGEAGQGQRHGARPGKACRLLGAHRSGSHRALRLCGPAGRCGAGAAGGGGGGSHGYHGRSAPRQLGGWLGWAVRTGMLRLHSAPCSPARSCCKLR